MAPSQGLPPPQPHASRLTEFAGHSLVVSVTPGQPELVAVTAASLGRAIGAPALYFAFVDPSRYTVEEFPDGTVRHSSIDPDADDDWEELAANLTREVASATSSGSRSPSSSPTTNTDPC